MSLSVSTRCVRLKELPKLQAKWNLHEDVYDYPEIEAALYDESFFEESNDDCKCDIDVRLCPLESFGIECGQKCNKSNCGNQVVKRRQIVSSLELFDTSNMGVGVRTTSALESNVYVISFNGEVISEAQYYSRKKTMYKENSHLYGMTFSVGTNNYTIDPTKRGNISRFINHSCVGNLSTRLIYVKGLPVMTLWSNRKIEAGEELFYRYNITSIKGKKEETKQFECQCNSLECISRKSKLSIKPKKKHKCKDKECNATFEYASLLRLHERTHTKKKVQCQYCSSQFVSEKNLKRHVKKLHKKEVSEKTYACKVCGKAFLHQSWLKRHFITHNK